MQHATPDVGYTQNLLGGSINLLSAPSANDTD